MFLQVLWVVGVLLVAAAGEDSRYVRVVSVTNRIVEPQPDQEEVVSSGYPLFVAPYPVYVERTPKTYPGFITPLDNEEVDHYGKAEVVRSPLIFTVKNKRMLHTPYPMKFQESNPARKSIGTSCSDAFYDTEKKLETEEKPIVLGGKYLYDKELPLDYARKETFQTPILIAEEKPGYKYVRHIVGAGVLPQARQFQVFILEEDTGDIEPENSTRDKDTPEVGEEESSNVENGVSVNDEAQKTTGEETLKKTTPGTEAEETTDVEYSESTSGGSGEEMKEEDKEV